MLCPTWRRTCSVPNARPLTRHARTLARPNSRFQHTFEDVFTAKSLQADKFFRVLAGNHDHKGNITAQIARTNVSARWYFPQLYYTFTEAVDATTTAQFVMIDTVTLAGKSEDQFGNELGGSEYVLETNVAADGTVHGVKAAATQVRYYIFQSIFILYSVYIQSIFSVKVSLN